MIEYKLYNIACFSLVLFVEKFINEITMTVSPCRKKGGKKKE